MSSLMTPPKMQFLDANGDPLSGGLIYFYEAGTATPKDTYTDDTCATPNPNPVVLDAGGFATIWLADDAAYKMEIKNSSDVLQYEEDNITAFFTGASASFQDDEFSIYDDVDNTKILMFQCEDISTGTTTTITVPDGSDTMVTETATQTLTNKTLGLTNTFTIQDDKLTIKDGQDPTKVATFQMSSISAGATRAFTWQDKDGTVALLDDIEADVQTFTASGTWTKPTNKLPSAVVMVELWGAGGGGGKAANVNTVAGGGGGGGAYNRVFYVLSDFAATEGVTVGAGGAGASTDATQGTVGGTTSIDSVTSGAIRAYGGGGGGYPTSGSTGGGGGGGGGLRNNGSAGQAGGTSGGVGGVVSGGIGGDGGATSAAGDVGGDPTSPFGGGGGGGAAQGAAAGRGAYSVWAGAGGGGGAALAGTLGAAGTSPNTPIGDLDGGAGGAPSTSGDDAPSYAGGGGGAGSQATKGGDGGDGYARITVY